MPVPYKISDIHRLYPNWYDPGCSLSQNDQQWIWENSPLPELHIPRRDVGLVSESVIGTHKLEENFKRTLSKNEANRGLHKCDYRSPPREIACYLEIIFGIWEEKPGHWVYIAQCYTPKTINSVISLMIKQAKRGEVTIQKPGAYFTNVIKFRPKRKAFRNTNSIHR